MIAATTPTSAVTEYAPSIVTSLFPSFKSGGITDTSSPILGIAVRNPLNDQAAAASSTSGSAQPLSLDAATIGQPTNRDQALENAYLQALSNSEMAPAPQPMAAASQPTPTGAFIASAVPSLNTSAPAAPAALNPASPAAYMNTQQYYNLASKALMQQQLSNMQEDVVRNYINSLYGQSIAQNLGRFFTPAQLQAMINAQENVASQQFNSASAPMKLVYVPSAYANENANAETLKKSLPALQRALAPTESVAMA